MKFTARTTLRRIGFSALIFLLTMLFSIAAIIREESKSNAFLSDRDIIVRIFVLPAASAFALFIFSSIIPTASAQPTPSLSKITERTKEKPYIAQVIGLQWLNPLQRRDYPTEWQLLWTLGLASPNSEDEMVESNPEKYRTIMPISHIANSNDGLESFSGFHEKYLLSLLVPYRDIYFSDSKYFYNAHSIEDKSTWRELAGIHVEYTIPAGKLNPDKTKELLRETIIDCFDIGNTSFPNAWSRDTPPDIRVTMGGPNSGYISLAAGLDYLKSNPSKTVWVMGWDAPSFPKDTQMDENMVLLILAGPDYKTERAPLAWLSQPATNKVEDFESKPGLPSRNVQAWKATLHQAAVNAGKTTSDIGFVIHDANATHPSSSDRLAPLAQTITETLPDLNFMKQTFNTPALLGEMGAGTALTNVALGIAYANHVGKTVLVAGTTDPAQPTATIVSPPAVVRPIIPGQPWFRARAGNHVYLPWWGLRHDMKSTTPGYSR